MFSNVSIEGLGRTKRLPIILQSEVTECGLACISMISSYWGDHIDLNELRSKYSLGFEGISLQKLIHVFTDLNFNSRPLRIEVEQIKSLQTPAILHWNLNHFVVLKKVSKKHIVIHDPSRGELRVSWEKVSESFTGFALEMQPASNFSAKKRHNKISFFTLLKSINGLKTFTFKLLALTFILQFTYILSPLYIQSVIDTVTISYDYDFLFMLALSFAVLVVYRVAIGLFRSYLTLFMSSQISFQLQSSLFSKLIRLPAKFFETRTVGGIQSRFQSLHNIKEILSGELIEAVVDFVLVLSLIITMFYYNSSLASIVLIFVLVYAVSRIISYQKIHSLSDEKIGYQEKSNSFFIESVRGNIAVKLFNKEQDRQTVWQGLLVNEFNCEMKLGKKLAFYEKFNELLFGLENILIVLIATIFILQNEMTIGMLFAFLAFKIGFTSSASSLINKIFEIKLLGLHLQRISDISSSETEETKEQIITSPSGSISLQNIKFRYSAFGDWVLDDISFDIKEGESLAIVGSSGSGKTTLVKLMLGLLQPNEGKIYNDTVLISDNVCKNYRKNVATVMQEDNLFAGTILDNISFFDSNSELPDIVAAAKLAKVHDDIEKMPMGYQTLVGDMGSSLSGGQKQRIILARALFKKPKILFLDEATAHLDTALEYEINENIKKMNITRIIVAHRQSTIDSADRIFYLEKSYKDAVMNE